MGKRNKKNLQKKLNKKLLKLLYNAKAGHIGCCLSCMDILIETFLFQMGKKDKFIFSKGHAVPALYIILNELGELSDKELVTFHKDGTKLLAHPPKDLSEITLFPTGSLGHGLSLAAGVAHAMKFKNKSKSRVYCLISDGECNEGQVWEAAQYAAHHKLDNLVVLVDNNGLQAIAKTEDVLGDSSTKEKWDAFGFETFVADGHSFDELEKTFRTFKKSKNDAPKIIICNTIKGYGVSFMENTVESHYTILTKELYEQAIADINKKYES